MGKELFVDIPHHKMAYRITIFSRYVWVLV